MPEESKKEVRKQQFRSKSVVKKEVRKEEGKSQEVVKTANANETSCENETNLLFTKTVNTRNVGVPYLPVMNKP